MILEKENKQPRSIPPLVRCWLSERHTAGLDLVLSDPLVDWRGEALALPTSLRLSPERHSECG